MRKLLLLLAFTILAVIPAFGQSTTVSGTVTDAGSQTWNHGTYSFLFVPNPQYPAGPYTWTGGAFNINAPISGSLSSSGTYSVSIPSNTAISPINSQWLVKFCPQANPAQCYTTAATTITGATQTLNATPPAIQVQPGTMAVAYADGEIVGYTEGSIYWNLTSATLRIYDQGAWTTAGGGGSSTPCTTTASSYQYDNAGAFGCVPDFTFNGTHTSTLGSAGIFTINGSLGLAGAAGFTVPIGTSFAATSGLNVGIDDVGVNYHFWNGANDSIALGITSVPTTAYVLGTSVSGSKVQATAIGPYAGGGTSFMQCTPNGLLAGDYFGVSGGICQELIPGLTPNNITTATPTLLLSSYRGQLVKGSSTSGTQTFELPDGTTTGFQNNYYFALENHGTVGALSLNNDSGTYTFNGAASPFSLPEGTWCNVSNNSTSTGWTLDCSPGLLTAGTGMSLVPNQFGTGVAIANTTVTPASYTNANITVNQQGQITAASNGSGGSSTSNAAWPLFAGYGKATSVTISTANHVYIWAIGTGPFVPQNVSDLHYFVNANDATGTDYYDLGIYGPCAPNTASCARLVDLGTGSQGINFATSGAIGSAIAQTQPTAASVPTAGTWYYIAWTGNATTASLYAAESMFIPVCYAVSTTTTTSGQLPSTIEIPAASWNDCNVPEMVAHQ